MKKKINSTIKHYLDYPKGYKESLANKYNNGCGASGWKGKLIPDTIYGLSIKEPCKIHDYMYELGIDIVDKWKADTMFYRNLLTTIEEESSWWNKAVNPLRRARAWVYFESVLNFGKKSFFNKDEDGSN